MLFLFYNIVLFSTTVSIVLFHIAQFVSCCLLLSSCRHLPLPVFDITIHVLCGPQALNLFFRAKAEEIALQCDEWVSLASTTTGRVKDVAEQVKSELKRYKNQPIPENELPPE